MLRYQIINFADFHIHAEDISEAADRHRVATSCGRNACMAVGLPFGPWWVRTRSCGHRMCGDVLRGGHNVLMRSQRFSRVAPRGLGRGNGETLRKMGQDWTGLYSWLHSLGSVARWVTKGLEGINVETRNNLICPGTVHSTRRCHCSTLTVQAGH